VYDHKLIQLVVFGRAKPPGEAQVAKARGPKGGEVLGEGKQASSPSARGPGGAL